MSNQAKLPGLQAVSLDGCPVEKIHRFKNDHGCMKQTDLQCYEAMHSPYLTF